MRRVLFVDDELQVLEGLRDSLRSHRREWHMVFAEGGEAALEELAQERFDVIVSDMRMPGMGGAQLLQRVREEYPETVRIVLSGHSEFADTLHAAPFAHQFLAKPCSPDELHRVIERSCNLHDLLSDDALKRAVAKVTSLPTAPETFREFCETVVDPAATADVLGAVVERDVALFAKLLQLVNSSFFGLGRRVTTGREAVACLGVATLRGLVLSVDLFHTFAPGALQAGIDVSSFERHAADVATAACRLAPVEIRDDAVAGGLLHDVGKLVLISSEPGDFAALAREAAERGLPLHTVEREHLGITHADVGAYLLGLWGLPYPLVDAVARHHSPEALAGADVTGVTARANLLVTERDGLPIDPVAWQELRAAAGTALELWQRMVVGDAAASLPGGDGG